MWKKFFIVAVLLVVGYFLRSKYSKSNPDTLSKVASVQTEGEKISKKATETSHISVDGINVIFTRLEYSAVKLVYNLDKQLRSSDIKELENCKYTISSFFYSKEFQPLGLLYYKNKTFFPEQKNELLNSYIGIVANQIYIKRSNEFPANPEIIFQSGPLIKYLGEYQTPDRYSDGLGRRILVANNDENAYIIALYDPEMYYSGPSLQQVNKILIELEKYFDVSFTNISNLDGGSASIFKNEEFNLTEYSTVGGFLCFD